MSPVTAFPSRGRESPPPPSAEVQKQALLDYLTAFGLAITLTHEEKVRLV